MTFDLTVDGGY